MVQRVAIAATAQFPLLLTSYRIIPSTKAHASLDFFVRSFSCSRILPDAWQKCWAGVLQNVLHWNMSDVLITNGLGLWAVGRRLGRHTVILALSGFLF